MYPFIIVLCVGVNRTCLKHINRKDGNIMLNITTVFTILLPARRSCHVANKEAHSFLGLRKHAQFVLAPVLIGELC